MAYRSEGLSAVFREPRGPAGVVVEERERTELQPGHVAVAIRAASLNHLDLWVASGAQRVTPPRVLGADGAGVVLESDDAAWPAGTEVCIYPVASCGHCDACRDGRQLDCKEFGIIGEHTDGTACQVFQLPPHNLAPRPAGLSWEESAAFPLTYLTAWRMIVTRARLQPGETMLVIGAGAGVAAAAIGIGRHLGARVIATSRSEAKRRRALELGAEAAYDSADFSRAVRKEHGGVDVVFEHVGPATIDQSLRSLRRNGRLVFCGSTSGVMAEVNMPRVFLGQIELLGSTMGNRGEFDALLGAIGEGLRPSIDSVHPLGEVQAAMTRMERAEQFGKIVLRVAS